MSFRKILRALRFVPGLETLESRLALSWAGIPPASVSPNGAQETRLDANLSATGQAGIATTEVDYYAFTAPRAGAYRFSTTTPSSNLDTVLGVFNSSGKRIAFNDDISDSNTDSQVTASLFGGQRYLIGITSYEDTPGGSYTWKISGPAVDDSYEDNDTLATARNLGSLNSRLTLSSLVMADSADWFRFTTTSTGSTNSFVSLAFTHSQGDLDLRLYSVNGTLLRSSTGSGNSERISLNNLSAGTYYVEAYGYRGASNPSYSLDIVPGTAAALVGSSHNLYLVFDGANLTRSDLVRWAGDQWPTTVNQLDRDQNGIVVNRFLAGRADREQVIVRMMQLLQEDLRPFGITVVRHTGLAGEGVGATTIFLGASTITNATPHTSSDVDINNDNPTDIAFVGDENWGSVENTALALADVTLHEAGHTWGLWHVASGSALETMGYRYNNPNGRWTVNTSFTDRTYVPFADSLGSHGQTALNPYQEMMRIFVTGTRAAPSNTPLVDMSRPGLFRVTTSLNSADRVSIGRLASGTIVVNINGRVWNLASGRWNIVVQTMGDRRDVVRVVNNLATSRVTVNRNPAIQVLNQTKFDAATQAAQQRAAAAQHMTRCLCAGCSSATMVDSVMLDWMRSGGRRR